MSHNDDSDVDAPPGTPLVRHDYETISRLIQEHRALLCQYQDAGVPEGMSPAEVTVRRRLLLFLTTMMDTLFKPEFEVFMPYIPSHKSVG